MALTWTISGTTATGTEGKTKITIKGLKSGFTVSKDKKTVTFAGENDSVAIDTLFTFEGENSKAIKIDKRLLGVTDIVLTDKSNTYSLTVEDTVKATPATPSWTMITDTGVAKLAAASVSKGYSISDDGKTISYSDASTEGKVYGVVSGLNPGAGIDNWTSNDSKLSLDKDDLNETNVAVLKGGFKLELNDDVSEPSISGSSWVVEGTTAYLVGTVAAGYMMTDSLNNHLTYSAGKETILAKLAGLEYGVDKDKLPTIAAYPTIGTDTDGKETISYVDIKLGNAALGSGNVSLIGGKGFQLAIDSISAGDSVIAAAANATGATRWVDEGATIRYETGTKEYYTTNITESDAHPTLISYHKETLNTAFSLVGINEAVEVDSVGYGNAIEAGISLGTGNDSLKVTLDKQALAEMDVTLEGEGYTLATGGTGDNTIATPSATTPAFKAEGDEDETTAYYNQSWTKGYTLSDDKTVLDFEEATVKTLAEISGLKGGLTDTDLEGITTDNNSKFSLPTTVLGSSDVKLNPAEGSKYSVLGFASGADSNVYLANNATVANKNIWEASNGDAVFKKVTPEYWQLGDDNKSIKHYEQKDVNTKPYFTISGLRSNVTAKADGSSIEGIAVNVSGGTFGESDSYSAVTLTMAESVLTRDDVALTFDTGFSASMNLSLASSSEISIDDKETVTGMAETSTGVGKTFVSLKSSNAYVATATKAGYWTVDENGKGISYNAPTSITPSATITGLKTSNADPYVDVSLDGDKVTLNAAVIKDGASVVSGGSINIVLGSDVPTDSTTSYTWDIGSSKATFTESTPAYYSVSNGKITFTDKKTEKAIVSGINTSDKLSLTVDKESIKSGTNGVIVATPDTHKISIGAAVLDHKEVTIENTATVATSKYSLAAGEGFTNVTTDTPITVWSASNGTVKYQTGKSEKYSLKSDGSSISYTSASLTSVAEISGLKSAKVKEDGTGVEGIEFTPGTSGSSIAGTFTINGTALKVSEKASVKISGGSDKDKYRLALAENNDIETGYAHEYWDLSALAKSGAVSYKGDVTEGYKVATDGKSINYTVASKSPVEFAKITGIKKTVDEATVIRSVIFKEGDDKSIVLGKGILDATDVKLTSNYGYSLDDTDLNTADINVADKKWVLSGANAKYTSTADSTYKASDDKKTLTYTAGTSSDLISITGLDNKKAKIDTDGNIKGIWNSTTGGKVVMADKSILGTKAVSITSSAENAVDISLIDKAEATAKYWEVKSGKAVLKGNMQEGYTSAQSADNKTTTLTYAAKKAGFFITTLKGINKDVAGIDNYNDTELGITADDTAKTITLDSRALTNSDVTFDKGNNAGYTLALQTTGENYSVATAAPANSIYFLTVNGNKALIKNGKTPYYELSTDSKEIKYEGESTDTKTHGTISGLKKGVTAADLTLKTATSGDNTVGTVTLNKNVLPDAKHNAKVTLKFSKDLPPKTTYKLHLYGDDVAEETEEDSKPALVTYDSPSWTVKGAKATYLKSVSTDGWSTSDDSLTVTYLTAAKTKPITLATLNGVKKDASIAGGVDESNNTITLKNENLDKKKVTLGKNDPYSLVLGSDVEAPHPNDDEVKIEKKATADKMTFTATSLVGGYSLSDSKTINYTADKAKAVIASVSGLTKDFSYIDGKPGEDDETEIEISKNAKTETGTKYIKVSFNAAQVDTKKNKVTAGGIKYGFEFNTSGIQLTGTKDNDILISNGGKVSITPGKGNDYVELNNGHNLYVYAKGDGDDYISGFSATDSIQASGVKDVDNEVSIEQKGDEYVLTLGTDKITLNDIPTDGITVIPKGKGATGKKVTLPSADLLADDNFITANNSALSDLIKPASDSYTPYDFGSALQFTKEGKSVPQLTYTGNKK